MKFYTIEETRLTNFEENNLFFSVQSYKKFSKRKTFWNLCAASDFILYYCSIVEPIITIIR